MKTINAKKIIKLQLAILIYSIGSVLSKVASNLLGKYGIFSVNFLSVLGVMMFIIFIYALAWQKILKTTDLTIAYANKGMVLFWSLLWSVLLFSEKVTFQNVIGLVLIFVGILAVTAND